MSSFAKVAAVGASVLICLGAGVGVVKFGAATLNFNEVEDAAPVVAASHEQTGAVADYTYVFSLLGDPLQEPQTLQVDNSDFVRTLDDLIWSDWGSPEATAVGTMVADSRMDGEGRLVTYPVKVVASKLVEREALQVYSSLTVISLGDPSGYPGSEEFILPGAEGSALAG